MCQSKAEGGKRCAEYSISSHEVKNLRRKVDYHRQRGNTSQVTLNETLLSNLDSAIAQYGEIVSPMEMSLPDSVQPVLDSLREKGYLPLIVGGSVRDALCGAAPKDIDIEVYGSTIDEVLTVLRKKYRVDEVGKSFGVLKISLGNGVDLDVSVPRTDNRVGAGHRGFTIETDASMTPVQAASRRDYTLNAMSYDPTFQVCVDPYNGRKDLKNKVLRHVSSAFSEDPLRVWRGFQFSSRMNAVMASETVQLCESIRNQSVDLATERVQTEWWKFYAKGNYPTQAMKVLQKSTWDRTIPGLAEINTAELSESLESAVKISQQEKLTEKTRAIFMCSVIASNIGNISDRAHFIQKTLEGSEAQKNAAGLARCSLPENDQPTSVRQWAHRLYQNRTSIQEYDRLVRAQGDKDKIALSQKILVTAKELKCDTTPQKELLLGRDVLSIFPDKAPGKWVGAILSEAKEAQTTGVFQTKNQAINWLKNAKNI